MVGRICFISIIMPRPLCQFYKQQGNDMREPLKIIFSDETTSHLTKAASCQVIGYKSGKARIKNCAAAYVLYVRSNFLWATPHGDENWILRGSHEFIPTY
jgi:hypothetical protein